MSASHYDTAWMYLMAALNVIGIYAPFRALIETLGGRYSKATAVFAWICIGWAIQTLHGVYWEFFNDPYWFESDVIIFIPWSILVFLAGLVGLRRSRQNKRATLLKQQTFVGAESSL